MKLIEWIYGIETRTVVAIEEKVDGYEIMTSWTLTLVQWCLCPWIFIYKQKFVFFNTIWK